MQVSQRHPLMSSQIRVCPIPYRLDPYVGCTFGCKYCFARDTIKYIRKVTKQAPGFNYLIGIDHDHLKKWINSTLSRDSSRSERVAFKERIPLKLGTMSDPFPYIEGEARMTYHVLKMLHEIDYPVQISTKNPAGLAAYAHEFKNPNWAVNVTLTSVSEEFRQAIEPGAPTIENRLQGIRALTGLGLPILVRVQPAIYPYIMGHLNELITSIKAAGAYGIVMEGLKLRISMDKMEQDFIQEISAYLGYDIRQWYRSHGEKTRSDYELTTAQKLEYLTLAKELCTKYGMILNVGDNQSECRAIGCTGECCGTNNLRNRKVLRESDQLLDCVIDFIRGAKKQKLTIREAIQ